MKKQSLSIITLLYLLLPSFLFVTGWFKPFYTAICVVILSIFVILLIKDLFYVILENRHLSKKLNKITISSYVLVFLIIFLWLMFSGVGGAGYQNLDYVAKNALIKDLIVENWPISGLVEGSSVNVVYYMAYYLPAALIGKGSSWIGANIFIFLWTLSGILLSFAWFKKITRLNFNKEIWKLIVLTLIFCLAGGLDFIGAYFIRRLPFSSSFGNELWATFLFQYSSQTTLVYWAPQHAIPSWLLCGFVVDLLYNKTNLYYLGIAVVSVLIWSPFAVIGVAPMLIFLVFEYSSFTNRRFIFNVKNIILNGLAVFIGILYVLYLNSNKFDFPIGFTWQIINSPVQYLQLLFLFLLLEFAFLSILVIPFLGTYDLNKQNNQIKSALPGDEVSPTSLQKRIYFINLAVLFILPVFNFGYGNDLVMRASIPALFIFWAFISKILLTPLRSIGRKLFPFYVGIVILMLIGTLSSLPLIVKSIKNYHLGPPPITSINPFLKSSINNGIQMVGDADSIFYKYISK